MEHHIFLHKYGGIQYSDFDYKIEDGKTYWCKKDTDYQIHKEKTQPINITLSAYQERER